MLKNKEWKIDEKLKIQLLENKLDSSLVEKDKSVSRIKI